MKKIVTCLSFFLILGVVATPNAFSYGWTDWGKITDMYVAGSWVMVHVEGVYENPDNCGSNYYYAIEPEDPNYEAMNATLLSAYMSGKEVDFYVSGCEGQYENYPHILGIRVRND